MFKIQEIADAVINWKGTSEIVIGGDYIEFKRSGRPHAIRLETSRYEEHRNWRLVTGGLDYPLPREVAIRVATSREAKRC